MGQAKHFLVTARTDDATREPSDVTCPLCGAIVGEAFFVSAERTYFRCGTCALIFVPPDQHLPPLQEVLRYLEHRNDGSDSGYVEFLRRLADPVCARVPVGARGLDFGCGP